MAARIKSTSLPQFSKEGRKEIFLEIRRNLSWMCVAIMRHFRYSKNCVCFLRTGMM